MVELLRERRKAQAAQRLSAGPEWEQQTYNGKPIDLVFTTPTGGLVLRQAITKAISTAAGCAGIDPKKLGTHAGRRSVVTALYADAGESIEEIARLRSRLVGDDGRVRTRPREPADGLRAARRPAARPGCFR